jgi:hypothetical protein
MGNMSTRGVPGPERQWEMDSSTHHSSCRRLDAYPARRHAGTCVLLLFCGLRRQTPVPPNSIKAEKDNDLPRSRGSGALFWAQTSVRLEGTRGYLGRTYCRDRGSRRRPTAPGRARRGSPCQARPPGRGICTSNGNTRTPSQGRRRCTGDESVHAQATRCAEMGKRKSCGPRVQGPVRSSVVGQSCSPIKPRGTTVCQRTADEVFVMRVDA